MISFFFIKDKQYLLACIPKIQDFLRFLKVFFYSYDKPFPRGILKVEYINKVGYDHKKPTSTNRVVSLKSFS